MKNSPPPSHKMAFSHVLLISFTHSVNQESSPEYIVLAMIAMIDL